MNFIQLLLMYKSLDLKYKNKTTLKWRRGTEKQPWFMGSIPLGEDCQSHFFRCGI